MDVSGTCDGGYGTELKRIMDIGSIVISPQQRHIVARTDLIILCRRQFDIQYEDVQSRVDVLANRMQ